MHQVFEIETATFKETGPRPDAINEMIGGDEMAAWVRAQLCAKGHACTEFWPEDHGWDFFVELDRRQYMVVSSCDFEEAGKPAIWHAVQLSHQRSIVDRLLGRNRTPEPDPLLADLRDILKANKDFKILAEHSM